MLPAERVPRIANTTRRNVSLLIERDWVRVKGHMQKGLSKDKRCSLASESSVQALSFGAWLFKRRIKVTLG